MKRNGNFRGEVRVNFLALFASKPDIFVCGALKLSGNGSRELSLRHCHCRAFFYPPFFLTVGAFFSCG